MQCQGVIILGFLLFTIITSNPFPFNSPSEIPTITGIGHQPDITIADYVSDFHAETPTHAATKATKDKNEIFYRIAEIEKNLFSQVKFKLKEC